MTGPQAPPGKEGAGPPDQGDRHPTQRTAATTVGPTLVQAGGNVPAHRPWRDRVDAPDVEIRYRRSVHYWLRRGWYCSMRRASTYGLTAHEMRSHAVDLAAAGWSAGEIATVLDQAGMTS